jgi:DNA-binding CsgD family transcriptional regulator
LLGEAVVERFEQVEQALPTGPHWVGVAYANRAQTAVLLGDSGTATAALEQAVSRQRALGFSWGLGDALRVRGDLARERGDYDRAATDYREAVALWRDHHDLRLLTDALTGLAGVAAHTDQAERAARLYGAASAQRTRLGTPIVAWDRRAYERGLDAARSALSPEAFAAAWQAGEALSLESLVAGAIEFPSAHPALRPAHPLGLTAREVEVVRLLVEGLTDREIAEALSISERTAGNHVQHAMQKIGADSRTAAAVYAVRHGLV